MQLEAVNPNVTSTRVAPARVRVPAVDVYESATEILVMVDVPGVSLDNVALDFDRGTIRLVADRKDGTTYRRDFATPDTVDVAAASASLDKGVLALHLPKASHATPRKIAVTAA